MAANETSMIRLVLDVDTSAEPVSGQIGPIGGQPREFVGWTDLAAAIEQCADLPRDDP